MMPGDMTAEERKAHLDRVAELLALNEALATVRCALCALDFDLDRKDDWINPGIYIINGQSVCHRHTQAPYSHPDHGLGGMQARERVARWHRDNHPDLED